MRPRRGTSGLNGVLLVDKPLGMTSHDVVDALRRLTGEARIGHAGTLDPEASGLLVALIGKGTTYSAELTGSDKVYRTTFSFGTATDTDDAAGAVVNECPVPLEVANLEFARNAVAQLVGTHQQVPPAYSATKVAGQKGYQAARRGVALELAPRTVSIHSAELVDIDREGYTWTLQLTVSKGTYIRAIARDVGTALGTCAHVSDLRRLACGRFSVDEAYPLDALKERVRHPWDLSDFFAPYRKTGPRLADAEVVIGVFDGMHLGHRALIESCVASAQKRHAQAVMVTFDRLPETVLAGAGGPAQLYPNHVRERLAMACGIDHVITLPFTPELARLSPHRFIERELLTRLQPHRIWVGADFRFGAEAQADVRDLMKLGQTYGFETQVVDVVVDGTEKIGSTAIRAALLCGDVQHAAQLLGEPFTIAGTVTRSRGIGRRHGYPTANLDQTDQVDCLADGVYEGTVTLADGSVYGGAIFVGTPSNSTDGLRAVEAHLKGFSGDLNGESITLRFLKRLRDTRRVDSDEEIFSIVAEVVSVLD